MDKLEREKKIDYYDSDSPEEEPRKEKNQHTAFVATPKRRSKATLIGHSDSHEHADSQVTDIYNIGHMEAVYTAVGMHEVPLGQEGNDETQDPR